MDGKEKVTLSAKDVGKLTLAKKTRAERLQALCEKVHPAYKDFATKGCCEGAHGCLYDSKQIRLVPPQWKVVITDPVTGDALGGVGETIDAALTMLEGKIR